MEDITAHLFAGAILPGLFLIKSYIGAMVWPMALDDSKLCKIMKCCI